MPSHPIVQLNRFEFRRIRAGHPWVYERSIASIPDDLSDGTLVSVQGPRHEQLGTAIFNASSKIRLRIVDPRMDIALDSAFFAERLSRALEYRRQLLPSRTCFRLISAESDGLSGLIIDCYESATLFQITSVGIEHHKDALISAIHDVLKPAILIERNDVPNRKWEGLTEIRKVHCDGGRSEAELRDYPIQVEGTRYQLNLIEGNKTGLYLDQIDNHQRLRAWLAAYPAPRVLDCFSYIGGFSLAAAMAAPQAKVIGIDQSAECVEKARHNAALNGVESQTEFIQANVFEWLRTQSESDSALGSFDCIILDPPSFTKNRHTVDGAVRGYKELHVRALKLLRSGGLLLTYSCSHHISEDLLRSIAFEAALDTHSHLVELESQRQSLDHPVVPHVPESYYLKGFVYRKP